MSRQLEYHVLFNKTSSFFSEDDVTFTINKIRSRKPSVIYFKMYCYDMRDNLIETYTSPRWIVGNPVENGKAVYDKYTHQFNIPSANVASYQLELVALGVTSENPLYFTELMLQVGEFEEYHTPSEVVEDVAIKLHNSAYVNLYNGEGDYLQVIRPKKTEFTTKTLKASDYTVLAPHFSDDSGVDDDVAVFLECINQTEQTINVLR